MLGLILTLALMALALAVLLWAGTVFLQGYFYSEPVEQLYWRAPAAALALTFFYGLWCFLSYRSPERFDTLFNFSVKDVKEFPEFTTVKGNEKTRYTLRKDARGRTEYLDADGRPPRTHPDAIIVKEGDQEVEFKADRDAQGNFKIERGKSLMYRDAQGREMSEDDKGHLATFRYSLLFLNLFFNLLHLVAWFLVLWLVLHFQWGHALGIAVVFWLAITLTIMPMLLARVRDVAAHRAVPTSPPAAAPGTSGQG